MIIGLPKEIKNHECRVGLTPDSVKKLISQGLFAAIKIKTEEELLE